MVDGTEMGAPKAPAPLSIDELEQELNRMLGEVEGYRERIESLTAQIAKLQEGDYIYRQRALALQRQVIEVQSAHIADLRSIICTLEQRRR